MVFKKFAALFILIAVISAPISPACAFLSGDHDNVIELCSADGSIQTIVVDPVTGQRLPANQTEHSDQVKKDCGFCFLQSHFKSQTASDTHINAFIHGDYLITSAGTVIPNRLAIAYYQAQAPPSFI